MFKLTSEGHKTLIEPELFTDQGGRGAVRKVTIEAGPNGTPTKITAEILAPDVMVQIKDFVLAFQVPDGRRVMEIHLEGGEVLRFPRAISATKE